MNNKHIEKATYITISILVVLIISMVPKIYAATPETKKHEQDFTESITKYKNAKDEYDKLQKELNEQQTNIEKEKTQNFLQTANSAVINYLKAVRKKIENINGISEGERLQFLSDIDNQIAYFTSKEIEIADLSNEDDMKNVANEMKDHWQRSKLEIRRILQISLAEKGLLILDKMEKLEPALQSEIESQDHQTMNSEEIVSLYNEFKKNLEEAKDDYLIAKEKPASLTNIEEANKYYLEETESIKEANKYLREAFLILKEIISTLKS